MTTFGDADPEDGWDPDDPLPILLDNLWRRVVALVVVRQLADREQQRLELLEADLRHVIDRVRDLG